MVNFVCFLFILLIYGDYCFIEADAQSCNRKFVGVVDGGSSGTRLEIFEFLVDNLKELKKGYRFKSKIPLSKFSDVRADWSLMRAMFNNLTENAKKVVPSECVAETAIYVQVTAGIRQLEESVSIRILNEVRAVLLTSTFKFQNDYVSILDIEKEGRFAWITVNYLFKRFDEDKSTYGMLDLGGGSTQVVFETTNDSPPNQTVNMTLFGKQYNIYVAGYNYMGINEIRAKYFNATDCVDSCCREESLGSKCMHHDVQARFKYRNCEIPIYGRFYTSLRNRFSYCYEKGVSYLTNIQPIRMYHEDMDFVGISAFYYIISSVMANKSKNDTIKYIMHQISSEAYKKCTLIDRLAKGSPFVHFLCVDMSYIAALFFQGYKFRMGDKIHISKSINGTYLSWALGFAISTF